MARLISDRYRSESSHPAIPRTCDDTHWLMIASPKDLAKAVIDRWHHMVAGEYETPPCPSEKLLRNLVEVANLAAALPDEGRYPQFNIVALPPGDNAKWTEGLSRWPFENARPLSPTEFQRLAPVVDAKKSAIWVEWQAAGWKIAGLIDLGTSWHRARMGLAYFYRPPSCLLVQVDGPERLRVYQGEFRVATLAYGKIENVKGIGMNVPLHAPTNRGLEAMAADLVRPSVEDASEFEGFEFIALCIRGLRIRSALKATVVLSSLCRLNSCGRLPALR
jgi:hypothetical protein